LKRFNHTVGTLGRAVNGAEVTILKRINVVSHGRRPLLGGPGPLDYSRAMSMTDRRTPRRASASMADVARAAGVSVGTVSHVLNHPDRVRESTRQRVQGAIDQLGFVRNSNASFLAAGENRTIGLIVIDIGNSLFVDIARGAQHRVGHETMSLLLANSDNDDALQDRHLDFFNSARLAGVLLAPMRDPHLALDRARRLGTAVVVLNYRSQHDDHCSVLIDNEEAGYLAARHMIDIGRRRLAFVGGRDELQPVHDRRMGVRRAVAESGSATLVDVATEALDAPDGDRAGEQLAAQPAGTRPDGVIAVTDLLGMAIIQALSRHGLSVPGDVAVMGCDYNSNAWGGTISLTSVRMRGQDMGRAGIDLLLEELSAGDDHEHRNVVLRPSLIARESTVGRSAP
jgi:LacI family transcriptional regulator